MVAGREPSADEFLGWLIAARFGHLRKSAHDMASRAVRPPRARVVGFHTPERRASGVIEESYVRLYAHDFARLAVRAETRPLEPDLLPKRIADARAHAGVMDAKKGAGHLEALVARLRDEARRPVSQNRIGLSGDADAIEKRQRFLTDIADTLSRPV